MSLFKIEAFNVNMKLLALMSVLVLASSFSADVLALKVEAGRVPTAKLVEGIKSRDGRWFEVEMIVFKRTDNVKLREQFSQNVKSLVDVRQWDLVRELLQPDLSYYLTGLPECHQDKNPLADVKLSKFLSPSQFYNQMMAYQRLINEKWQFTNELCLMPNESLVGYWDLVNDLPRVGRNNYTHVPYYEVPKTITTGGYDDFHNVYVIGKKDLKLTAQFNKLESNPTTEPMLHIGWRQPGLSKRDARPVYIIAGKNYTDKFKYDGSEKLPPLLPSELELESQRNLDDEIDLDSPFRYKNSVQSFMRKLQSGAVVDFKNRTLIYPKQREMPAETWQVDGFIKVHLDHYLYIDGQFNFRELSQMKIDPIKFLAQVTKDKGRTNELDDGLSSQQSDVDSYAELEAENPEDFVTINYLKNYNFKQTRKSYSGDLHYLDHPKMGILIQIRKYRH
ncbi:hypothetical protein GCM10008107_04010 [Psychrosphaera saromensis]|uniref:Uncharacterized protein n=1 Tax=Psychrosphaera saromensis TaxID=716813 RepID=A0A2S7UXD2_9GAMM|nr:CsiV family protein [Psychrosphaera saromensis]PQJ54656.1 hypothetical protein BTO11_14040 [Psychrosphaera saromensis]GHB58246.1 hypothetical protein GCM10008107_04010 [Psychrosphaera saromensis]GLQ14122.1 hypothetical protein GCM10007917_15770 [Psychrosphaera saromensis]